MTARPPQTLSSVILLRLLVVTFSVSLVSSQDAASLITGLLSTFAESSSSPGCPGECRHRLSALFCSYVQEGADCGDSKLLCCTDPPPEVLSSNYDDHHHDDNNGGDEAVADVKGEAEAEAEAEVDHHRPYDHFNQSVVADEVNPPEPNQPPDRDHTFHRPPMLSHAAPISVGTNLTVRPGIRNPGNQTPNKQIISRRPIHRRTTTTTAQPPPQPASPMTEITLMPTPAALTNARLRPCHGICVTRMVAAFCSQLYELGQCSRDEACCLTGDEVMDTEAPHSSSATFGTAEDLGTWSSTTSASSPATRRMTSATTSAERSTTTAPTTSAAETTTVVTVIRKPRPRPPLSSTSSSSSALSTPSTRRPVIISTRNKFTSTSTPPKQPSQDGAADADDREEVEPEEGVTDSDGDCPGSCIMGLLALLCDSVDANVKCSNGGQCCISKSSSSSNEPNPTRQSESPPPTNCPGICLPSMLTGICNRPAVLIPNVQDCEGGTVCCDNSLRETGQPVTTSTTTASPLMDLLSWPLKLAAASSALGGGSGGDGANSGSGSGGGGSSPISSALAIGSALSGLFGNGGSGSSSGSSSSGSTSSGSSTSASNPSMGGPSMFGQPSQSGLSEMRPQLSIDRTQIVPECPGTCIASFLKMTCFGSSLIVESFPCPKDNLVCCASKSSLVGLNPEFMNNDNHWNQTANRIPPTDNTNVIGYNQRPSTINPYVCGIKGAVRPETPRVVGGRDASPGEWCWQVALINSLNQYLCGGALIGRSWVLTAAHCVTNLIRSGDAIYIRVGDYDLTSKYGSPGAQTLRVATTYIHHNHNSQTLDNNIALLKLEKPVDLKEGICLVCLPARGVSVQPGKQCFVTGYGYMGESGPIPLRIRAAVLPVVSEKECVRKINAVTEKIFILPASSFCAGGEEGHDACQGDGGGPLSCEVDGYYEITGIVSWGFGCGRLDVPGIYVKVSSFIGWINQIISVNNI